jgi:hypothetical protein
METKNLIQTTANVIRITNLKKGDCVKIIDSSYSTREVKFGVVIDLLNDGKNTFIEMLEYKKNYNDINVDYKVYKGDDDIAIFPTEIGEVEEYLNDSLKAMKNKIKEKNEELEKLNKGYVKAKDFVSGELQKKLTVVDYKEITQKEYNHKIEQLKQASTDLE